MVRATPWQRMGRHGRDRRMVCPRTPWMSWPRIEAFVPPTAQGAGHVHSAQPVPWQPLSLTSQPFRGTVNVQRPGLPVPIQHKALAMEHHDQQAMREERRG
jgi:hypothetical protein